MGDRCLRVVGHEAFCTAPEELEGGHVASDKGLLVHAQHRSHEHVPTGGKHHDKGPHPSAASRQRVAPHPEQAIVDLSLVTGLDRRTGHCHLVGCHLVWELEPQIAPEARDRDRKTVLVAKPLVHGRGRVGLEHLFDAVVVLVDRREGKAAGTSLDELGEPLPDKL